MADASAALPSNGLAIKGDGERLSLEGVLDIRTLGQAQGALATRKGQRKARALDVSGLSELDTPGALFLCGLRAKDVELTGVRPEHKSLLDLVCSLDLAPIPKTPEVARWKELAIAIGRGAHDFRLATIEIVTFIGRVGSTFARAVTHPRQLRLPSISRQVKETGVDALPIVGLMAVMIAIVIAYQGVVQLRPYGGEDLTVNLVAVSMLREMGVLITAIIVAGRSGSAFAAEIGVMKAREEIDALKVMGLDPMELLVLPRLIGLVITLPLLTFFADVTGVLGGSITSRVLLNVSTPQYVDRVRDAVDMSDLFVGLAKAPVFALIIASIGCMHGLRVTGSAESVGKETTSAVVKTIFLVIVLDAFFSILFEKLGL
ncbi:MAG: MlaE family lipid ABC transporter permease subunit [Usitatibacter sp.]